MNELNPGYEELLTSLNAIQTELRVPKSQRNKYGNYNFRNCDDIVEAVKPLLKKYNLVLIMYDKIESTSSSLLSLIYSNIDSQYILSLVFIFLFWKYNPKESCFE